MFKNIDWKYIAGCTAVASSFIFAIEVILFDAVITRQFFLSCLVKPFFVLFLMERLIHESTKNKEV